MQVIALQAAYAANMMILVPIAIPTVLKLYPTDQGKFDESAGWRVLAGSLWTGIMILSLLGFLSPIIYSPVLLLQLIYKTIWLVTYAAPLAYRREWDRIPWGITASFLVIVLVWPWIIPWAYLFGQ